MRAAVYAGAGGIETIEIRTLPEPLCGNDDVVVRVAFAGLNRADVLERKGVYAPRDPARSFPVSSTQASCRRSATA